jgi:peptidoglycan/LPS O-acetylase OafA/YrhL
LSGKYAGKSAGAFYRARFLRLFPGYWMVLLITIVILLATGQTHEFDFWNELIQRQEWGALAWVSISNLFFLGQEWTRLLNPYYAHYFVPQAWTLSIEITFYLVAPWLIHRRTSTLIALAGISLLARALCYHCGLLDYVQSTQVPPLQLLWFLLGMLSFRAYARWRSHLADAGLGLVVAALLVVTIVAFPQTIEFNFILGSGWGIAGYYILQILTALALPIVFATTRNSRFDALVGELSYPLYLCHIAVLQYVSFLAIGLYRGEVIVGISFVLAASIAFLLTPIERWRAHLSERVPVAVPGRS